MPFNHQKKVVLPCNLLGSQKGGNCCCHPLPLVALSIDLPRASSAFGRSETEQWGLKGIQGKEKRESCADRLSSHGKPAWWLRRWRCTSQTWLKARGRPQWLHPKGLLGHSILRDILRTWNTCGAEPIPPYSSNYIKVQQVDENGVCIRARAGLPRASIIADCIQLTRQGKEEQYLVWGSMSPWDKLGRERCSCLGKYCPIVVDLQGVQNNFNGGGDSWALGT